MEPPFRRAWCARRGAGKRTARSQARLTPAGPGAYEVAVEPHGGEDGRTGATAHEERRTEATHADHRGVAFCVLPATSGGQRKGNSALLIMGLRPRRRGIP